MSPASRFKPFPYISLGRMKSGALTVNVVLPGRRDVSTLTCEVFTDEGPLFSVKSSFRDDTVRLYTFQFNQLKDGVTYHYRLIHKEQLLELGEGLELKDLTFTYWSELTEAGEVALLSCNGIYNYKGKEKHRVRMWDRLRETQLNRKLKLIIMGGDQYYQDSVESWIANLKGVNGQTNRQLCKEASLENALNYWSHPSYRKLMAQVPSIAMLDDHDITDGAGGRLAYFDKTDFKPEWKVYAEIQRELFDLLQAPRNPEKISAKPLAAYSFVIELGQTAIVAFDLRTEKNGLLKKLMGDDSKDALFQAIRSLKQKEVFLLLPIIPLRNSLQFESQIKGAIQIAKAAAPLAKNAPEFIGHGLEYLAECEDDLEDCLTSESNKDFFMELLKEIAEGSKRGVQYAILSGDIHTGGTVDMFVEANGHTFALPIIVSSPIGYDPMPALVEPILREHKVIEFSHNGVKLRAVVGRFTNNRNFVVLEMNRYFSSPNDSAFIYEESIPGRRTLLTREWNPEATISASTLIAHNAQSEEVQA